MQIIEKNKGCTINEFISKYKKEKGIKKLCFCGRLDPMARGKVIILIDQECKMVTKYLNLDKKYQFYICLGFQTDTDDFLGLIQKQSTIDYPNNINDIIKYICSLNNYKFEQEFHKYSSKILQKKSNNNLEKLPKHKVKIYNSKLYSMNYVNFKLFIKDIIDDIKNIDKTKNFRQNEIIKQWENIDKDYIVKIKLELKVSSGFYVRQFVRDLSEQFNFPMCAYDINRVSYYM